MPTTAPSGSPSVNPTTRPSGSPTIREDCWHFKLGECGCPEQLPIDVMFILDASGSIPQEEWNDFTEALALFVESDLPDTARLSVMSYSTQTNVVFPFSEEWTPDTWAEKIRGIDQVGGATWTWRALSAAHSDVWEPYWQSVGDADDRIKIVILVTDGEPSYLGQPQSMSPCIENGEPKVGVSDLLDNGKQSYAHIFQNICF